MAALHDEEFLDHARAAECLEEVLAIDAGERRRRSTKLPRHYRALGQWEELEELYEKHASIAVDRRRDASSFSVQRARVLAENIGSPDRAMRVYEQVLEIEPGHAGALEALARLREESGDAHAALTAIEALAAKAPTPEAQAEQWLRAARLLEGRGDRDGAIERYKLALEANPNDAAARPRCGRRTPRAATPRASWRSSRSELELAEGRLAQGAPPRPSSRASCATSCTTTTKAERQRQDGDRARPDERRRAPRARRHRVREASATSRRASTSSRSSAARATLPKEDAVRVLVRFIEAFGRSVDDAQSSPSLERAGVAARRRRREATTRASSAAVDALEQIAPDDADALARVARVMFECGDVAAARHDRTSGSSSGTATSCRRSSARTRSGASASRSGASASSTRRSTSCARRRTPTRATRAAQRAGAGLRADGRLGRVHRARSGGASRSRSAPSASSFSSRSATSSSRSSSDRARAQARRTSRRSRSGPTTASS